HETLYIYHIIYKAAAYRQTRGKKKKTHKESATTRVAGKILSRTHTCNQKQDPGHGYHQHALSPLPRVPTVAASAKPSSRYDGRKVPRRAVWGGGAPSWDPCAEKSGYRGSGWHRVIKSPTTPPREATLRMMRKVGRGTASGAGAALRCCCRQRRQLLLASMVMLSLLLEVLVLLMRRLLLGVAARRRERHLVVRERQRQLRLGRGLVS
ncbi:unnamed protein product, partial [Ectocarpus fasciculatus]